MKTFTHKKRMLAAAITAAGIILAVLFTACNPEPTPAKKKPKPAAKYTVTLPSPVNGNSISIEGGGTEFAAKTVVTLKVNVADGFKIDGLTLSAGVLSPAFTPPQRSYTFQMPAEDVTVNAAFSVAKKSSITVITQSNAVHAGTGTAKTDPADEAFQGSLVTITTAPAADSYAMKVFVSAGSNFVNAVGENDTPQNTVWTFEMPGEDVTVTVEFADKNFLPIKVTKGSVTGGSIIVEQNYFANEEVTVELTPDETHKLAGSTVTVKGATVNITATRDADTNKWFFTMPAEDVTVLVEFAEKQRYNLTLPASVTGGSIAFTANPAANGNSVLEDATVTLTLTVTDTDNKQYKAGDLTFTCPDSEFDIGLVNPADPAYVWSFKMPEAAVAISVTLSERPAHSYTLSSTIQNQTGGAAGTALVTSADVRWTIVKTVQGANSNLLNGQIREHWYTELRIAFNRDDFDFQPSTSSITITTTPGNQSVEIRNTSETPTYYAYFFDMPESNINITTTLRERQSYNLTSTAATNGSFTLASRNLSGTTVSPATTSRAGYTVTITGVPAAGYSMQQPTVTPATTVTYSAKNVYTFIMPASNVSIAVQFLPAGAQKVYSNGVWQAPGLSNASIVQNVVQPNDYQDSLQYVTAVSPVSSAQHDGHASAIRVQVPGTIAARDVAFSIRAPAAIDLSETGGLSFWVYYPGRVNGGYFPIRYVGFGEHGTAGAKAMIWLGENNSANWEPLENVAGWKRIIVPVPKLQPELSMRTLFTFKCTIGARDGNTNAEYFLIDDIEFLSGNAVALDQIIIPNSSPVLEAGQQRNAINMVQSERNDISLIYKTTAASGINPAITTTVSAWPIDNDPMRNYPAWGLSAEYDFTINNANATKTGTGVNTVIHAVTPNTNFTVTLSAGGKTSNPMTVNIPADNIKILEDWEANPPLVNGEQGYWRLFGWSGVDGPNSGTAQEGSRWASYKFKTVNNGGTPASAVGWNDQTAVLKAGRNFPTAQNLTGFATISFWINPNTNNPAQRALAPETFIFTLYNGTTYGSPAGPSQTYYNTNVANKPAFSKTFTLTNRGSTAETVKGNNDVHWLEVRIPVSELVAATGTLNLAAVTGWSVGVETITSATDFAGAAPGFAGGTEYVLAIDNLIAEKP